MTIKEARKILGKLAIGISDEELLYDVESAKMLKNMFFNMYLDNLDKDKLKSNKHE